MLPHSVGPKLLDAYRSTKRPGADQYERWGRIIYSLQCLHDCELLEATRMALKNAHLRRWVESAINTGNPCRKYALAHIRVYGSAALVIREGEAVPEIIAQIEADPEIGVLVLGAGDDRKGPGPLVTQLSRSSGSLPVPITIIPGDLSKEKLEAIT